MKKKRTRAIVELIFGIILIIGGLSGLAIPDAIYFTVIFAICGVIFVILALVTLSKSNAKNTHTVEGTFLSIGKYGDGWVGCYFEIKGKETRIAILNDVYNPKLLMPGAKYTLTLSNKDETVLAVERI